MNPALLAHAQRRHQEGADEETIVDELYGFGMDEDEAWELLEDAGIAKVSMSDRLALPPWVYVVLLALFMLPLPFLAAMGTDTLAQALWVFGWGLYFAAYVWFIMHAFEDGVMWGIGLLLSGGILMMKYFFMELPRVWKTAVMAFLGICMALGGYQISPDAVAELMSDFQVEAGADNGDS
ncbi:Hypothetical protein PBC10988_14730 [Planctomycetales bacterium 10988]|nr:Hypothetical protein PBC10988_14730 [Planctomycetales bacterium 10988]